MQFAEILNRFGYHKGTEKTVPEHTQVREDFIHLASRMDDLLPEGRAKAIALTKLEEAAMWANKAVAEQAPVVRDMDLMDGESELYRSP